MKHPLQFRADGTFTIVQFTDVHWKDGGAADQQSLALMKHVIETERPDLIVFTGDVVGGYDCSDPARAFREAVAAAEQSAVPWAVVFGNHDTERHIDRKQMMAVAAEHAYTVAEPGPEELSGVGNYWLSVTDRSGATAAALYFFDSGSRSSVPHVEGYDWIRHDQIGWYKHQSHKLARQNGGTPVPALAFFHIPLPEYLDVWETEVCYGHKLEDVCCAKLNSGLFAAMVEMGDVAGTFAGHDHINDYWGELHGIRLCYGRATGCNTYGREGFPRGARIIRLTAGSRDFESWLRLSDSSVITEQPCHAPEQKRATEQPPL